MRPQLKISHIGLILIGVPLAFELFFVLMLSLLLYQADSDLKNELRSKQILFTTGMVARSMTQGGIAAAAYNSTKSDFFRERYVQASHGFKQHLKELEFMLVRSNKKEQLARMDKINQIAKEGYLILDQVVLATDKHRTGQGDEFRFEGPLAVARSKHLTEELSAELQIVMNSESQYAKEYTRASLKSRQSLQYFLMAFVGLSIGGAILLATYFSTNITKRLRALIDNTKRVPRGETLTPTMDGTDEIAELDQVFHDMVDELYSAQKMKQYFLSMVSHDLRSPLTSVQGLLTLLGEGALGEISDRAKARVQGAEGELGRLVNLTNDLLDVERFSEGKMPMDIRTAETASLVDSAKSSLSTLSEKSGIKVESQVENESLEVDPERIVQVLVNLLSNAIKFSRADSTIRIVVKRQDSDCTFEVFDQGRGIPKEMQDKIFARFEQVERSDSTERAGIGLGLAICKSIVEAHGGRIGVESSPNEGSRFWFTIPTKAAHQ